MDNVTRLTTSFADRETIGDEILSDKQLLVDYDRRRQSNREALTAMRKDEKVGDRVWMLAGDIFVKVPKDKATAIVNDEQKTIDEEMQTTRERLKGKVEELEEMEGRGSSKMAGFNLKPVKASDLIGGEQRSSSSSFGQSLIEG